MNTMQYFSIMLKQTVPK